MITFREFLREAYSGELQQGGNAMIYTLWDTIKPKYPDIKSMGIWGDKAHQMRKSDHNTGDAIDIGVTGTSEGDNIVRDIINGNSNGPYKGYIKYIIFNRQIWYPGKGAQNYTGQNPHTTHVHVSFNRGAGTGGGDSSQWPGGGENGGGEGGGGEQQGNKPVDYENVESAAQALMTGAQAFSQGLKGNF